MPPGPKTTARTSTRVFFSGFVYFFFPARGMDRCVLDVYHLVGYCHLGVSSGGVYAVSNNAIRLCRRVLKRHFGCQVKIIAAKWRTTVANIVLYVYNTGKPLPRERPPDLLHRTRKHQ